MSAYKNILIIGANRGIGLQLVKECQVSLKPNRIFATYRNADQSKDLFKLAANNSAVIHLIQLEAVDESRFPSVVQQIDSETHGTGLNLLICNAGISQDEPQTMDQINRTNLIRHFEVNCVAPLILAKAFLPLLEKSASSSVSMESTTGHRTAIINISSQMGSFGDYEKTAKRASRQPFYAYRSSKAALNMFTKTLSMDLEDKNILAVAIHPGSVQTDLGFPEAPLTAAQSAEGIVGVILNLGDRHNGSFLQYDGQELPW